MARIRTVKPEFWTDEKVVELSAFARLLFIGLWNFCDDDGRMVYSPKRIKMQIFPADNMDISELFGELRRASLISVYQFDSVEYLQVDKFTKHQKIDKRTASKLPAPPTSAESPRITPTDSNGREGNGKENTTATARPTEYSPEFEEAWSNYPQRAGDNPKLRAYKAWRARLAEKNSRALVLSMQDGVKRYANYCRVTGKTGTEFVMQAATFFGPDHRFMEPWNPPAPRPGRKTVEDYRREGSTHDGGTIPGSAKRVA